MPRGVRGITGRAGAAATTAVESTSASISLGGKVRAESRPIERGRMRTRKRGRGREEEEEGEKAITLSLKVEDGSSLSEAFFFSRVGSVNAALDGLIALENLDE